MGFQMDFESVYCWGGPSEVESQVVLQISCVLIQPGSDARVRVELSGFYLEL